MKLELTERDVLVMATDGLWDVTSNDKAADVVDKILTQFMEEKHKYISGAQALVANARGKPYSENLWRTSEGKPATGDDVSVFVIPILPHKYSHQQFDENVTKTIQQLMLQSNENSIEVVNSSNEIIVID